MLQPLRRSIREPLLQTLRPSQPSASTLPICRRPIYPHSSRALQPPRRTITTSRPQRSSMPSASHRNPSANPSARPDLLYRDPQRPLPTLASLSSTRRWLTTLPIFFAIIAVSAAGIFNYQKVNSPIIAATLYSLRTSPEVRAELGDEVYFASGWAWVWGTINTVKGNVDVTFSVKGRKKKGVCRFKARRVGGLSGLFQTTEWSLTTEDGKVMQLLDPARDPLAAAGV